MIEVPAYGPNHEEVHHKQVCTNNADLAACLCMFNGPGMEIELRLFIAWGGRAEGLIRSGTNRCCGRGRPLR
jgi:hypothetical protein